MFKRVPAGIVAATAAALLLSACGSSSSDESASADRTQVDVGTSQKVSVPKKLKTVAFFAPGTSNTYMTAMIKSMKAEASAEGIDLKVFDPGYDPTKQLNQIQSAVSRKDFDAALVMPADGSVVCKAVSEQMPDAGILVGVLQLPICNLIEKADVPEGEALWQKGTLNFVSVSTAFSYQTALFDEAAAKNPGPQKALVLFGVEANPSVVMTKRAAAAWNKDHTDWKLDLKYGDFTAPTAFNIVQTYLKAHPDTTVVINPSGFDGTVGAAKAIKEAGLTGKVKLIDAGAGDIVLPLITSGELQFSTGEFPGNTGAAGIKALVEAAETGTAPKFVDSSLLGTYKEPFIVTKDTLEEFKKAVASS